MPAIVPHNPPTIINDFPYQSAAWKVFDLAPYLKHQGSVGVLMSIQNPGTGSILRYGGIMPINAGLPYDEQLCGIYPAYGIAHFVVPFIPGYGKQVLMRIDVSAGQLYPKIYAELRDGVVFHTTKLDKTAGPGELSSWREHRVTLVGDDTYDDVEAVITRVHNMAEAGDTANSEWNMRRKGSTTNLLVKAAWTYPEWCYFIVGVDSVAGNQGGYYQTRTNGKADPFKVYNEFYELGYIKKGEYVAITNPVNENLPNRIWGSHDFSATTENSGANLIIGRHAYIGTGSLAGNRQLGFRTPRSPEIVHYENSQWSNSCMLGILDGDGRCEFHHNPDPNQSYYFYVIGYEVHNKTAPGDQITIVDGEVDINNGEVEIG